MKKLYWTFGFWFLPFTLAFAATVSANIYSTDDDKKLIGQVVFRDTTYGLLILPNFTHLPPGLHGFHLHQNSDCEEHGMKAGGHYDPQNTNTHQGPYGQGHLGDLPVLYVTEDGKANIPVLAPRLKTHDLENLAVMIHEGGDNYSDHPKLGGGGARIGCGIVKLQ